MKVEPIFDIGGVVDGVAEKAKSFSSNIMGDLRGEKEPSLVDGMQALSYPSNLDSNDSPHENRLIFRAVHALGGGGATAYTLSKRQDAYMQNPASVKGLVAIQLYMPSMEESVNHTYSADEASLLSELAGDFLLTATGKQSLEQGISNATNRSIIRLVQDAANKNKTVANALKLGTGQIFGKRNVLSYGGTELRKQTFKFNLRAKNLFELKQIGEIIHAFRVYSSGTIGKNYIFEASGLKEFTSNLTQSGDRSLADSAEYGTVDIPPIWYVEERTKSPNKTRNIDKFFFGPAVITGVKVNKTPYETYQTIANTAGDPTNVELEITMQEMLPAYSNFWNASRNNTIGGNR